MLISCVAYENGQRVGDVPVGGIRAARSRPGAFIWVALKDPEPGELETLQAEFDLHDLAVEDAQRGHQRPKLEEYGNCLFAVIQTVEQEGEDLRTGEAAIFVGPNYVLTVRRATRLGFADVRTRTEQEPELLRHGPAYVFYVLLDTIVDRYFPVVAGVSEQIEELEEGIFSGPSTRATIEKMYGMKRKLMTLKHTVHPLLEVTGKLFGGRVPPVCAGLHDYFRDVHDHLTRLNQHIDDLRDMITTAVSVNLSLLTIQDNEVTKRLAAYAALVAVPTMIGGIYGMNFQNMPELHYRYGYPIALGAMALIDGYLIYRFRKAKWF
jgi:magnesium transporter